MYIYIIYILNLSVEEFWKMKIRRSNYSFLVYYDFNQYTIVEITKTRTIIISYDNIGFYKTKSAIQCLYDLTKSCR